MGADRTAGFASTPRAPSLGAPTRRAALAALVGLLVLITLVHVATLRPGHDWGGDFALYIHHAKNIVEGAPYADTGFIHNPNDPMLSPRAYPPVFPALLTPVYAILGLDLEAMKGVVIATLIAALVMIDRAVGRELSLPYRLALLAALGLNPYILQFKNSILSEFPFLLFTFATLWLAGSRPWRDPDPAAPTAHRLGLPIAMGTLMYLAFGTRAVGAALPLALVASELTQTWSQRRQSRPQSVPHRPAWISRATLIALATFAALATFQRFTLPTGGYLGQVLPLLLFPEWLAQIAGDNLRAYAQALVEFWENHRLAPLAWSLTALVSALALLGYVLRWRAGPAMPEMFVLAYLVMILFWPAPQDLRFLIPLLPLYLFYALQPLQRHQQRQQHRPTPLGAAPAVALLLVVAASYASAYTRSDFGPIDEGIAMPETVELFEFLDARTSPTDTVVFIKPRVLALFTQRPSTSYFVAERDSELWHYINNVGATHLLVADWSVIDQRYLRPFVERHAHRLTRVFENDDFELYRIRGADAPSPQARDSLRLASPRQATRPRRNAR